MAATFSWLEPARPYLVVVTILVLSFAWFQKLKPRKEVDCDFATLMLAFPYYSGIFLRDSSNVTKIITIKESDIAETTLSIEGMTCTGCEHSVNHALTSQEGVIEATSSFETGIATVKFDKTKVSVDQLAEAVEKETATT